MNWIDSLSGQLPAPRDDEPGSLRDDILAELTDHLQCAAQREQARGGSPEEATRQALAAFGDPAAVARRLWLDAMKGRLMTQKISIGLTILLACVCLGALAMTWNMIEQNRAVNAAMLEQLADLKNTPASGSGSPDWNPFKVRLAYDRADGDPVVGWFVNASNLPIGAGRTVNLRRPSDKNGVVDFGLVQPGAVEIVVETPWEETGWPAPAVILPGTSHEEVIICPRAKRVDAEVEFSFKPPEVLRDKQLVYEVDYVDEGRRLENAIWKIRASDSRLYFAADGHRLAPPKGAPYPPRDGGPLLWPAGVQQITGFRLYKLESDGSSRSPLSSRFKEDLAAMSSYDVKQDTRFTIIGGQKNQFVLPMPRLFESQAPSLLKYLPPATPPAE